MARGWFLLQSMLSRLLTTHRQHLSTSQSYRVPSLPRYLEAVLIHVRESTDKKESSSGHHDISVNKAKLRCDNPITALHA